jgi:hypothetical protein
VTVDDRIAAFMPIAGSTAAAIFLTTYRTGELRALLEDTSAGTGSYVREAVICTLLPVLTALLFVFALDLALDSLRALTGKVGFSSPQAAFVLFVALLIVVLIYQVFLAVTAWKQLGKKRTNA